MTTTTTVIRSTNEYVIRMQRVDGKLRLYVHQVVDGAEMQPPRGYMAGSNYLEYELKK